MENTEEKQIVFTQSYEGENVKVKVSIGNVKTLYDMIELLSSVEKFIGGTKTYISENFTPEELEDMKNTPFNKEEKF
jgi:hypothetical protein